MLKHLSHRWLRIHTLNLAVFHFALQTTHTVIGTKWSDRHAGEISRILDRPSDKMSV